jgi:F-type H+-transporting ATPase subunit delta
LFQLALDRDQLNLVAGELSGLESLLNESADLVRLVRSPLLSRVDQGKAMTAVLQRAGASELVRNFVGLMAQNRRLFLLDTTLKEFRTKLAEHRGEVSAEVTSAAALKPEHLNAVKEALRAVAGRDVAIDSKVDPALIGGLVVKIGSRMIDNSIRTKLQNLELAMKGA